MNNKIVILAGGDGTRLFPFSTKERPKYLLPLCSSIPMISEAFLLAKDCVGADNIYIVTTEERVSDIQNCIRSVWNPEVTKSFPRVIIEKPNGTFYSVMLSGLVIANEIRTNDFNMLVMPADANFKNREAFIFEIKNAFENLAKNKDKHILFGMKPSKPTEKFGYITYKGFIEKPSIDLAKEIIEDGALWNMGFLGMNFKDFLNDSSIYYDNGIKININGEEIDNLENLINFSTFIRGNEVKKISIDYAYLNKLPVEKFIVAEFPEESWSDMGSIEELIKSSHVSEFVEIIHTKNGAKIVMEKGDSADSFEVFNLNPGETLLISGNNKRKIKQ